MPSLDGLRRPLLDEEAAQNIVEEWNASVSAFVGNDGGEENSNCYCPSIDGALEESRDEDSSSEISPGHLDDENTPPELHISSGGSCWKNLITSTLFPDSEITLGSDYIQIDDHQDESDNEIPTVYQRTPRKLVESIAVVKFVKFVVTTILSIFVTRWVVLKEFPDHDSFWKLWQLFTYEGDSIVRDLCVFFVVGRLSHRSGVDTLEWMFWGILANIYFESQGFVPWMQHAVTLYEMHCIWPWQLWVFAVWVVLASVGVGAAHVVVAHRRRILSIRLVEFLSCLGIFVAPLVSSPYFHFHHWFAGWLLGMHANLHDRWWSRAAMAYCWGMYVNGLAVYGRDPLLTCEYVRFLQADLQCPSVFVEEELPSDYYNYGGMKMNNVFWNWAKRIVRTNDDNDLPPADWRNCSSSGYHP